mmetsp:Transcript_101046/g.123738  ORF Transcript_101046/g.123738 Transcript_101046/m.123738 type:complete len:295 (-) Transcript_101046:70-954(-)
MSVFVMLFWLFICGINGNRDIIGSYITSITDVFKDLRLNSINYVGITTNKSNIISPEYVYNNPYNNDIQSIYDYNVNGGFKSNKNWWYKYGSKQMYNALYDDLNKDGSDYIPNFDKLNVDEPIYDVVHFEIFNELFCNELINISDSYGIWSGANENDSRVGGYEAYPTNDIHLNQMGLHDIWEDIIFNVFAQFVSYYWNPFKTKGINIAFVVKYTWNKHPNLTPHHDASTYSIVIALNKPNIDFKGGGTRFVRQNVTINGKIGYATIHPGRLTHYHEGVPITHGDRYIFVTFVD